MEPILFSLQAVLRGTLILAFSLSVFAQIVAEPQASVLPSNHQLALSPPTLTPPPRPVFEFRGIRIGDEMKDAERKFLSLKAPSLSSKPGLCGSDGIKRIETCTDVLDTGEYVNMTLLDRRVAQIYVSMDRRTQGNTYNSYVVMLDTKYGRPETRETKYYRNGVETGSSGGHLRWLNGDEYMEGGEIERAITSALMTEISISVGLLIALFAILVFYRTRKPPQIAAYGSQRMCPSCGLITSRLKEHCLECGQSLAAVSVTLIVE